MPIHRDRRGLGEEAGLDILFTTRSCHAPINGTFYPGTSTNHSPETTSDNVRMGGSSGLQSTRDRRRGSHEPPAYIITVSYGLLSDYGG